MHYYSKDVAEKLVRLEIENRKHALSLYDEIEKVVRSFDGKVLNKRLETALQGVYKYTYVERRYNSFAIEICVDNDWVKGESKYGVHYVECRNLQLTQKLYTHSDGRYEPKENVMINNPTGKSERIIADVIIEGLKRGKKGLENEIADYEKWLTKVDEAKEKLESLTKEIESVTHDIPYLIRDYFDLNYYVRKN